MDREACRCLAVPSSCRENTGNLSTARQSGINRLFEAGSEVQIERKLSSRSSTASAIDVMNMICDGNFAVGGV